MTDKDHGLLVKLLNLTTSDNDHEALSAIRRCNAILKSNKLTWNDFYHPNENKGNKVTISDFEDLVRRAQEDQAARSRNYDVDWARPQAQRWAAYQR